MSKKLKPWYTITFFVLLFMLCVSMLCIGRTSAAQELVEEPAEEHVVPISPPQYEEGFQQLWIQRQEAKTAGDMIGERYLEEIIQRKLDKGISNLWEYALILMREGMELADKDGAVQLGEFARRMAPDLPPVYFYAGQKLLGKDSWKLSAAIEQAVEGIKAYARNIPLATIQSINFLYIMSWGVLLAILAFCFVVFFKRSPLYFHALKKELAGDMGEMIRGIGRIILFFLPLFLAQFLLGALTDAYLKMVKQSNVGLDLFFSDRIPLHLECSTKWRAFDAADSR